MKFIEGILEKYPAKWIKRVSIITIGQILAQGMGFVFLVILAWFYTKEDYGYLRYVINIGSFAAAVVSAGVPAALARYFAKNKGNKELMDDYFSNGIAINIFLMACASIVLYAIYQEPLLLMIMLGYSVAGIYQGMIRGLILYRRIASFRFLINTSQIVLLLSLVYLLGYSSVKTPLVIYGVTPFLIILIYTIFLPLGLNFKSEKLKKDRMKEISVFSSWVMTSVISSSAAIMAITVILEHYWGYAEVATYSVAYSMITPFVIVTFGMNMILYPKMAETDDSKRHVRMMKLAQMYSIGVSLFLIIIYYFIGDWLIRLLFSENYISSYLPMMILCVGSLFINVRNAFATYFEGTGKPQFSTADSITSAIVAIIVTLLFARTYGALAGAWGITLGFGAACVVDVGAWIMRREK